MQSKDKNPKRGGALPCCLSHIVHSGVCRLECVFGSVANVCFHFSVTSQMAFGNNSKVPVKWNNPQPFLWEERLMKARDLLFHQIQKKKNAWLKLFLVRVVLILIVELKAAILSYGKTLCNCSRSVGVFRETLWAGSRVEDGAKAESIFQNKAILKCDLSICFVCFLFIFYFWPPPTQRCHHLQYKFYSSVLCCIVSPFCICIVHEMFFCISLM